MSDGAVLASNRESNVLALVAVFAAVAVGLICSFLAVSADVAGALVSATGAIPAGIGLYRSRKRRDPSADLRRLRQGELRRPVALVVVLLAVSLLAWDSLVGAIIGSAAAVTGWVMLSWLGILLTYVGAFVLALYAGHYLGSNPYALGSIAVVGMLVARVAILMATLEALGLGDQTAYYLAWMLLHIGTWAAVLLGISVSRRRQERFIAEKAAKLESTMTPPSQPSPLSPDPGPERA